MHVRGKIFKLNPIQASEIYQIPWICSIQWIPVLFRENSNTSQNRIRASFTVDAVQRGACGYTLHLEHIFRIPIVALSSFNEDTFVSCNDNHWSIINPKMQLCYFLWILFTFVWLCLTKYLIRQECIPVWCVPPAAVAICWRVVSAWRPPRVWAWRPPGCGPGDPPGQTPQPPPLDVGLETPAPLWTEFLTHASENIILPQLCCGP